jgi:dihydrofolate synthase/folylpolyglutamate synthase
MRLGVKDMRAACARFGAPERTFEAAHVAGTNGKGSVCAMLESIARAAGKKTGLYTSPHLCRFAERIQIGGAPIDDDALAALLVDVLKRTPELSFFETATLAAFVAFREARVDLAVIEVGIGGRLDATNVIPPPRSAAVTRVAFDHTDKLGATLLEIAREKAAIAKPGVEMVVGAMEEDVRAAVVDVARAAGATVKCADADEAAVAFARQANIGLNGAHQRSNAKVAFVMAKRLALPAEAILRGVAEARWPGRLETIETRQGPWLLDAAHNPDGVSSLVAHLRATRRPVGCIVFGALSDKPWPEMLDLLAPLAPERVYVAPQVFGGGRAAADASVFAARHPGKTAPSTAAALELGRALAGSPAQSGGGVEEAPLVVVAGSLYLVGEARALLLGLPRDPPVSL